MAVKIQKSVLTPAINASALVDVAFQLIVYFVLVARFDSVNRELPATLPTASASGPASFKPKELVISVNREGQISVSADATGKLLDDNKTIVTEEELVPILEKVVVNYDNRQEVKIHADKAADLQSVVVVINACQKAGVHEYALQTSNEK